VIKPFEHQPGHEKPRATMNIVLMIVSGFSTP
jgi:hypothetical protein